MNRPKKRIWPSCICINCSKRRRQRSGATMGMRPSKISIRPKASSQASDKTYFRAGAADTPPRMTLKNSELAGSSTITSLFLAKLVL